MDKKKELKGCSIFYNQAISHFPEIVTDSSSRPPPPAEAMDVCTINSPDNLITPLSILTNAVLGILISSYSETLIYF